MCNFDKALRQYPELAKNIREITFWNTIK